ncbi:MAG TPA: DUF1684 domain-containing protein [Mycobacteriales bacterium]|nr:DUF1684 domain-containing protein [Mycobacteriales bacterium]
MSLELLDWRRETAEIYRTVREDLTPEHAYQVWCRERRRLFGEHAQSAGRTAELRFASYDPAWRFDVPVAPAAPLRIEIATATDGLVPFERIGRVSLPPVGTLDVWWLDSYGGGIWLPLRDANPDTYGGGRYVLDTVKGADLGGADGRLIVDLNFAYNPSCAYDEAWACPLAPEGNRTTAHVPVGELLPA